MATITRKIADFITNLDNSSDLAASGIQAGVGILNSEVAAADTSVIVGKTAQALTGTIATSTAYYGVNFTCTGNLTINDTLLIGRMLKDQSAVSLTHTAATAVTITGTGTLVFGTGILIQPTA